MSLCTGIYLLLFKNWKLLLQYIVSVAAGLATVVLIWPQMIQSIFYGYRGKEAVENLAGSGLRPNLKKYIDFMDQEMFDNRGKWLFLLFFAICFAIASLYIYKKHEGIKQGQAVWFFEWIQITVSVLAYIAVVAKISPYRESRYIFIIYPLVPIIFTVPFYKLLTDIKGVRVLRTIVVICAILLAYRSESGVMYLYTGTDEKLAIVESNSELPAILLTHNNRRFISASNCIYLSENAAVYPIDESGIETLGKVVNAGENRAFVLYIDMDYPDCDAVLKQVLRETDAVEEQLLFKTSTAFVYKVSLKT